MLKYVVVNKVNGALISKAIKPVLDTEPKRGKKYEVRKKINDDVFGIDDSVADNAKMITILTNMLVKMYDVMPTNTKSKLDESDKALMDHISSSFDISKTNVGKKITEDMGNTVDKLFNKQYKIGEIIDKKNVTVEKSVVNK